MAVLKHNSYGKASVRITKIVRNGPHHQLFEMSVDISLTGEFSESYLTGDNSKIIATDSLKNTVYVLGREKSFASIEEFAIQLARHFVQTYPQVHQAVIDITQPSWQRVVLDNREHTHAFVDGGAEQRVCRATLSGQKLDLTGGIADLRFLKTTGSEFHTFVNDRFRTLKDTRDRIFATSVEGIWTYNAESADFNATFTAARHALLQTISDHHSLSAQQTLLAIGDEVLKACPSIRSIRLSMPNLHRIPVDLKPFGLENHNDIFVPIDEPHGVISGVVERE